MIPFDVCDDLLCEMGEQLKRMEDMGEEFVLPSTLGYVMAETVRRRFAQVQDEDGQQWLNTEFVRGLDDGNAQHDGIPAGEAVH